MRIAAFTLSYWGNSETAQSLHNQLAYWNDHVNRIVKPVYSFIASGTYSDQALCPIGAKVINAFVPFAGHYSVDNNYALAGEEAALWHIITETDCTHAFYLCGDGVVGFNVREYADKLDMTGNMIVAPNWLTFIDDACYLMSRAGIVYYLNHRLRPNIAPEGSCGMMSEDEKSRIFNGRWICPHTVKNHCRADAIEMRNNTFDDVKDWPVLIRANPELREQYLKHRHG